MTTPSSCRIMLGDSKLTADAVTAFQEGASNGSFFLAVCKLDRLTGKADMGAPVSIVALCISSFSPKTRVITSFSCSHLSPSVPPSQAGRLLSTLKIRPA